MSATASNAPALPPHAVLMQMVFGKAVTQAISVVARYRLADRIAEGPKTAAELASSAGLNAGHLYRVLRALAGIGVLSGDGTGRFALTPMGEFLRSDVPGSMRAIATYVCDPWSWKPWGDLAGSVASGAPAFDRTFGEPVFDYLPKHPDEAATFNEGMTGFSQQAAAGVLKAYDFTTFRTIVDVGGGHGFLLSSILSAAPNANGVLYDLPQVTAGASNLPGRCRVESGSFFEKVPAGGDLYVLKHIIHDWNDASATQILKCVRAAIAPGGKLLLVELVVPPGFPPHFAHLLDLEMMVICDGKERTEDEYRALFAGAGFRLTRVLPTECPHCVIEAEPV